MSLLLLFNQPAASPPTDGPGGYNLLPRPATQRPLRRDERQRDDEVIVLLVAKYLEIKDNRYEL